MSEENASGEASLSPGGRFHVISTCRICREEVSVVLGASRPRVLSCTQCGLVLAIAKPVGGYVYVLSNKSMPHLVKIGFSTRDVESRIAELNASTSIPEPFNLEASFPVERPTEQEAAVHSKLAQYRHSENREFFRLQVSEAVAAVKQALLVEAAVEPLGETNGAVQVFGSDTGRGVIVKISPTSALSSLSEVVTTPQGHKFALVAAFLVSNRGACAADLKAALAYRRDGFGIWDVNLDEALLRLVKITRQHQKLPLQISKYGNARSVISSPPVATIFWSPTQDKDQ